MSPVCGFMHCFLIRQVTFIAEYRFCSASGGLRCSTWKTFSNIKTNYGSDFFDMCIFNRHYSMQSLVDIHIGEHTTLLCYSRSNSGRLSMGAYLGRRQPLMFISELGQVRDIPIPIDSSGYHMERQEKSDFVDMYFQHTHWRKVRDIPIPILESESWTFLHCAVVGPGQTVVLNSHHSQMTVEIKNMQLLAQPLPLLILQSTRGVHCIHT